MHRIVSLLLVVVLGACRGEGEASRGEPQTGAQNHAATLYAGGTDRLSPEELESGRMVMDWRAWVERDTTGMAADTTSSPADRAAGGARASRGSSSRPLPETWDDIGVEAVNEGPVQLPVGGDVAGPSVLRVQILLDRAVFSPGIIDGRWGRNTEKAVYWLQRREGLEATGEVDERTWVRLARLAGEPAELVRRHVLTEADVAGPFVTLPEEWYERRDLDCQCYESLAEKLAERFHASEELLRQLNPDVDLNAIGAGTPLHVPALDRQPVAGSVAHVVVSDGGMYVQAMDEGGRILYHFPATLGSAYSPSPTGDYRITAIAHDPTWHYQPELLEGVADDKPDAILPPGPNNAVGVVWMQLSKPHYGIHGTPRPETIGYTTSNGCVRLTNWDADFLSRRVSEGTPVRFRDVD
jgi:lipoprotein-anchoring transpeptidase ErfK/SrfK